MNSHQHGGDGGLFFKSEAKFLLISLVVHAVFLWIFLFHPSFGLFGGEKKPESGRVIEVVDVPPSVKSRHEKPQKHERYSDADRRAENETFTEGSVMRSTAVKKERPAPKKEKKPSLPAPKAAKVLEPSKKTGQKAFDTPPNTAVTGGERPVKEGVKKPSPDALTHSNAAITPPASAQAQWPEKPMVETSPPLTSQPSPGEAAAKTKPNLFLSGERLAELSKQYEKNSPKNEKGKMLSLDTSELKYQKYLMAMKQKIELYWEYPSVSVRRGEQGDLRLSFTVRKDGTVSDITVIRPSAYPALTDAAVTAIRLAAPFNRFPDDFDLEGGFTVHATFEYKLYDAR